MKKESIDFLANFKGLQIFVAGDEGSNGVPWHFHTTFEEAYPKLEERQEHNWGIYFTVNELDRTLEPERKRTKKMLKKIRAIYCDYDDPNAPPPKFPLTPSISVESSPGKFQFYWLTTTDNIEEWTAVQQHIVNNYGGDNQAKDLARYLRIPGFNHCKKEPVEVKLLDNNGKQYDWNTIKIAFPPEQRNNESSSAMGKGSGGSEESERINKGKSIQEHDTDIIFGRHFHSPVLAHLQRLKDGDPPYVIKSHLKNVFEVSKNFKDQWEKTDKEWQHAYDTIDYQVDEYVKIVDGLRPRAAKIKGKIKHKNDIPEFPEDLMSKWPEPWPMIWKEYKKIPRTLDQCLLVPTILSIHAFLLNAIYVTDWGKRPNMAFLNIAPSTGNKDVNSENVIRTMLEILARNNKIMIPFTKMVAGAEGITSDTAFLQSFNEDDLFWVNTESTHLFQQMAQAGMTNSSVKALESKIIDVVDGGPIRGKRKAGKDGNVSGIDDPNAQVLLYAQPETISAYLKGNMVDSGLLGRMILHIPVDSGIDPFLDSFKKREKENRDIDNKLLMLYDRLCDAKTLRKKIVKPTDSDMQVLQDWMMEIVKPMSEGDHSVKMLKRLAISAEQLYVLILGICMKWDEANNRKIRTSFDASLMFPILEYWAKCKVYVLREYIEHSIDPLADSIKDIIEKLLSGEMRLQDTNDEFASINNVMPRSEVYRVASRNKKLRIELDARNDSKNIKTRINNIVNLMISDSVLIEIKKGCRPYIGIHPDYGDIDG